MAIDREIIRAGNFDPAVKKALEGVGDYVDTLVDVTEADFETRISDLETFQTDIQAEVDAHQLAENVITTNVIAASESGKTFILSLATGFVSTLPAPAAGLKFKFVVGIATSGGAYTIVTNAGADIINGQVFSVAGAANIAAAAEDTVTLDDADSDVGDWLEFVSDGTQWIVNGVVNQADGVAFTATP